MVSAINPYQELDKMLLTPGDVLVLADFVIDENYIPAGDLYRWEESHIVLDRVNSIVIDLVNEAGPRRKCSRHGMLHVPTKKKE